MLIGNVGKDPEVRYLDGNNGMSGNAKVATLTLATTERYRDRNGSEIREKTEWHNIVAWRSLADLAEKFIRKGTQIYVEGKLTTRSWTDQSGNKRYTTEVVADSIQLLGKRSDNTAYQAQPQMQPQPQMQAQPQAVAAPAVQPIDIMSNDLTDDLPF